MTTRTTIPCLLCLGLLVLALPGVSLARPKSKTPGPAWCAAACQDALHICRKTCDRKDVPVDPKKCKEKACPTLYKTCMKECAKEKGDDSDEEEKDDDSGKD